VKTNGRFYMTRAPKSVPSFLDTLLPDVLAQTREANLFAPTGTRNYWPAEMIDYYQGSDHDLFLGVGVPSTMFGHDPDWTHHTSEDTPDKTDASEFLRVGVLAANATYWIATQYQLTDAGKIAGATQNRGYHRLTIPPIFSEQLFNTPLAKENDLALYETINFLDGRRGSDEIAKLLREELNDPKYDKAWVDRVLSQLEALKYVAK
jgi:hypothetical protein